jgi:hypothetical protein
LNFTTEEQTNPNASPSNYACRTAPRKWRNAEPKLAKKKNHPGTKLKFPARLPTSLSTSSEFHSQVRDGLAWFHWSKEHQSISGAKLRRLKYRSKSNRL